MPERGRFHSPFAHWVSGLLIELAAFAAFLIVVAAVAVALAEIL